MVIARLRPVGSGPLLVAHRAACLALCLALWPATARAQSAGATPADFSVDASGTASARLAIAVPPGPHGVQPELALAYASGAPNGLVGVGWTVQGVSAITRTGPSKYYDGDELAPYWGQVSFGQATDGGTRDRFLLDGQRLIAVKNGSGGTLASVSAQNGAYGKAGTQYHTALESWTKVTSNGTAGVGPQSFTAYQKDGTLLEYGATEDSRIQVPGGTSVRVWALSQVRDPNGNAMTFQYAEDNASGEYRLASIRYTANSNASFTARNRVDFVYEDRDDRSTAYQASYALKQTKRLKEIQTYAGSTRVKTYKLAYGYGRATRRSRLTSVQECDGNGACMPATTFSYSDFTPDGTFNIVTPSQTIGMEADKVNVLTGDVNGDGKTDLLRQEKAAWDDDIINSFNVMFSTGTGQFNVVTPTGTQYQDWLRFDPGANILPGDFNGDGKTDFLRQEKGPASRDDLNTFNVYLSNGNGYFDIQTPSGAMYQIDLKYDPGCNLLPADANGDGVADFLRQEKNDWVQNAENTFSVYFSNRDGYFTRRMPAGERYQVQLKYNPGALIFPGDFNGDGAADFLRQEWNDWDNDTRNTFQVYFSRRDGTYDIVDPSGADYQDKLRHDPGANLIIGDYNGDGLQDFIRQEWGSWDNDSIGTFQVYFSRGNGYSDIVEPAGDIYQGWLRYDEGALIIPGDFNGDGVQDFLRQARGKWAVDNNDSFNVYLSRGDGYSDVYTPSGNDYQARLKADHPGVVITVGDYNGDGIDDFMAMRKNGSENGNSYWVYLSKGPFPDLLTSFTDGLRKTTTIVYKPLTDSSVYTKGSGAVYPVVDEQPAAHVVASFTLADGNGNSVTQSYTYEGLKARGEGSGISSFAKVTKLDTASGVKQVTEYHQSAFLSGQASSIAKVHGTTTLERTEYTYHPESAIGAHPYTNVSQPLLQRTDVKHYVAGAVKYTTRQEYSYDLYGNITQIIDHGDVNVTSERLYTTTQYRNDESAWMLGLVTSIKQSSTTSAVSAWEASKDLTWERRSYDARGNPIRQERYDDQNGIWFATSFARDAFGDPTGIDDPTGNSATLVYDDTHTYARERRVGNGSQPALVTRFAYDPRFGEMTSQTDPNGRTLSYTLDGFGRFTAMQGPRPDNPSQTVELVRREWANTAQGLVGTIRSRVDWNVNDGNSAAPWYWEKQYTDGFGRVYKKESLGPDSRTIVEDTSYTPQGWVSRRTFPHWSTETGSSLPAVVISYNARGIPTRITSAGVTTDIAMGADGKSFSRTEAAGTPSARTTTYVLDSRLKVVSKTDAERNVTTFQYDPLSRPTKVTDPSGVIHTTSYTSLGLKKEVVDPATGTTQFRYTRGLLTLERDADGNTIAYAYDAASRVTRKTVTWTAAGATQSTVVDYQYDTANGAAGYTNLLGNVHRVTTTTQGVVQAEYRYGYDAYGRASVVEAKLDGLPAPFVFRYGYDPLGRKIEQVYPDNARARMSYQPNGDMTGVALEDAVRGARGAPSPYTTYRGYTARGEPTGVEYGNGVQAALTFDPARGMLTRNTMTYGSPASASSPKLVDDRYTWNPLGDVTEIKDLRTGAAGIYDPHPFHDMTRAFTYTAAGRLARANAPGTYGSLTYTYSPGGDLQFKDGVSYSTGVGHRVTGGTKSGATVFTASYDARGNRVTATRDSIQWSYTYDGENRMLAVTKGGAPVGRFAYDHTGRRTRKTDVATGTTTWYVADDYEVTTFGAAAGGATQHTKYVTGLIGPAASVTRPSAEVTLTAAGAAAAPATASTGGAGIPATGVYFLHKDHVGSTAIVTDAQGRVVSRTVYKPFGDIDAASSEGSDVHRAKFGGQELDGDSGLYYFNARYYDARIGRFVTADSVMGAGFLQLDPFNRYAFAGNNPIRNVDPSGHSFIATLVIGAIVGATVAMAGEIIHEGRSEGWGNIKVGKVLAAGVKGAISGMVSAAVGGGAGKVADKAVKKLTKSVTKGVERALEIGVAAVAGAAGDAAVQAASNGIQIAQGKEVDWARSMILTVGIGAIAGGAGEALDGWKKNNDVKAGQGKGARQTQPTTGQDLSVRDELRSLDAQDWGIQLGVSAAASQVSSQITTFFSDPANDNDTTGNAFSVRGRDNAPMPMFNGRMIINVVARQACLGAAQKRVEGNGAAN